MLGLLIVVACSPTGAPTGSSPANSASASRSGQLANSDQSSVQVGFPPVRIVSEPENAARQALEASLNVPYENIRTNLVKNDGTFATVEVTVALRPKAADPWADHLANYELAKVGSTWQ